MILAGIADYGRDMKICHGWGMSKLLPRLSRAYLALTDKVDNYDAPVGDPFWQQLAAAVITTLPATVASATRVPVMVDTIDKQLPQAMQQLLLPPVSVFTATAGAGGSISFRHTIENGPPPHCRDLAKVNTGIVGLNVAMGSAAGAAAARLTHANATAYGLPPAACGFLTAVSAVLAHTLPAAAASLPAAVAPTDVGASDDPPLYPRCAPA